MDKSKPRLTLDQPAAYQIKVPGELDLDWSAWDMELTVTIEKDEDKLPVTSLRGSFDQAALQGLLRRLYALGLPLISVIWDGN